MQENNLAASEKNFVGRRQKRGVVIRLVRAIGSGYGTYECRRSLHQLGTAEVGRARVKGGGHVGDERGSCIFYLEREGGGVFSMISGNIITTSYSLGSKKI
jgi:hypothetical protein